MSKKNQTGGKEYPHSLEEVDRKVGMEDSIDDFYGKDNLFVNDYLRPLETRGN